MSSGKRRCDGVCHTAKHATCTCICLGKFHGALVTAAKQAEKKELEELVLEKAVKRVSENPFVSDEQPRLVFSGFDLGLKEDYTNVPVAPLKERDAIN